MDQNTKTTETPAAQATNNTVSPTPQPTMNVQKPLTCSTCHQLVKETEYFCHNCGKNLKPTPLSTSIGSLVVLLVKSTLLPPIGIILGFRYLKQKDTKSKVIGLAAIVITVLVLVIATRFTINILNTVNTQVNDQLQKMVF